MICIILIQQSLNSVEELSFVITLMKWFSSLLHKGVCRNVADFVYLSDFVQSVHWRMMVFCISVSAVTG